MHDVFTKLLQKVLVIAFKSYDESCVFKVFHLGNVSILAVFPGLCDLVVCYLCSELIHPYAEAQCVQIGNVLRPRPSLGAGQQTYSYSADISAPTHSEDPDYKSGTSVHITIVTEDDQKLLDTTTSAFPYRMGCTGITSEYGTLTMTYEVTIVDTYEEEVQVDEAEDAAVTETETEEGTQAEDETAEGAEGATAAEAAPSTETEPENADHSGQNGGTKTVTRTVERTEERTITRDLTFTPEN